MIWTQAPTSGKWHVAGEPRVTRHEVLPRITLLCGWVIHSKQDLRGPATSENPPLADRCRACVHFSEKP